MHSAHDPDRIPVIIGVGEGKDRPADPSHGLEPAALAERALRRAEDDAGAALLGRVDSLDVVGVVSWPYDDLPGRIAAGIAATPARARHGPIGGQTPVQFIHEAAQRIARGESGVAAICGAESSHTATAAARAGIALPWSRPAAGLPPTGTGWLPARDRSYLHPLARRHGITEPVAVYPLYETAATAAWGQDQATATAESAALWSQLSDVAAQNDNAWLQQPRSASEIATVSRANRMIAWPYPKLMVANPAVNQGAAVLLTSLAQARALGVADDRLVFVHGGAAAAEPADWLQRDSFVHAAAQEAVLSALLEDAGGRPFAALELYSCFPIVPKMALRHLGLPLSTPISAAGGLTFHGAPLNNYMTHGAAALVRALRRSGGLGLLYGQGGHLTRHYGLILGDAPAGPDIVLRPADVSDAAERRRGPVPPVVENADGQAMVEAFTVLFHPDGTPNYGAVILRVAHGIRTLARVPGTDRTTIDILMAPASPVGLSGTLARGEGGLLTWRE